MSRKVKGTETMSKHAYLVMAHSDWSLLGKLLRCIDDPRNAIYIHVDKKADFPSSQIYKPQRADCVYICKKRIT